MVANSFLTDYPKDIKKKDHCRRRNANDKSGTKHKSRALHILCLATRDCSCDSTFYSLNTADLVQDKFELFAIMEGTSETSSITFQAKYDCSLYRLFKILKIYHSGHLIFQVIFWGDKNLTLYWRDHNKYQF
jgi:hypothetical protein